MSMVTRRAWLLAAAALAVSIVVLHHEVLLSGMVYHLEDAADGYYPAHLAAARAFAEGTLPTWERGSWCGWPLANDPYYGVFYPLGAIFWLGGAVRGLGWSAALHAVLAALGMLWLLERRKLKLGPALLGAVGFGLSSFMVVRLRHIIFPQLMAWLPLMLVAVEDWLESRRRRALALLGASIGLSLLCGALPLAFYVVMAVSAYTLPRLIGSQRRGGALLGLAAAALAGGLIGAAQAVPTVAHIPYSPRQLGVDYAFASSYAWPRLDYLATLVLPNLFGTEDRAHWFGAFNHWEMAGYYAGAPIVLLAPLGLLRARKRPELWWLAGLALVGVLLAFGDHGPLHKLFFDYLPLYGTLRCPARALILDLVALPLLAAEGLTWLCDRESRRARTALVAAGALLSAAGLATLIALARGRGPFAPNVGVARDAFAHLAWVVAAGGLALAALSLRAPRWRALAPVALALVALCDLFSIDRGYLQPKPADFAAGSERFAAVDWLIAQHPAERFVPAANGPFRLHNLGMTYGLEGAGGYDSVTVWRMVNLLWTLNHGSPYPYPRLRDDVAAGTIKRFDSPLVDLLNVRFAIATGPPAPKWIERFRPAPGAPPHARYEPLWDPQLGVYENPDVLPRAFVVYGAQLPADDAAAAAALTTLDPRTTVLLDRAPDPAPIGDSRALTPAIVTVAERHRVVIEAEPSAPGVLVLSETWYPGWSVTVDGRAAPLLRADYALRGVALSAGKHTVEMRFASRPVRVGLALSLLGCALLGLFGLARRRGGPPPPVL